MKIVDVRAGISRTEAGAPVKFALGPYGTYSAVIVEVEADEGLVGRGEAIARLGPEMAQAAVIHLLRDVLLDEDPRNIQRLWLRMMNQMRRWGHSTGVVVEAISGVDIALWDLIGQAEGRPVWQLLYGVGRSMVPCYASSIYINEVETMRQEAVRQVAAGFSGVKVKIGLRIDRVGQGGDLDAICAIRDAVGKDIEIYVDANGAYDACGAIRVAKALEEFDIAWFEEPLPPDDLDGYAQLHRSTSIPLARGETDFSVFAFQQLASRRLVDVLQPDMARCGGITAGRQIGELAYAHNMRFAPHTGFSGGLSALAALHVASASPSLETYEYMYIDNPARDIFVEGFPVPDCGQIAVPKAPGLGLTVRKEVAAVVGSHGSQ